MQRDVSFTNCQFAASRFLENSAELINAFLGEVGHTQDQANDEFNFL
jgi:hypothetical protein